MGGILTLEEVSSISTCILIGLLEYIAKISAKLSTIDEIFKKKNTYSNLNIKFP